LREYLEFKVNKAVETMIANKERDIKYERIYQKVFIPRNQSSKIRQEEL
jgi:hypothetical protein